LPHFIEVRRERFRSALELTLQDTFGIDCLEEDKIEPDANHVLVHVDSHVGEINLCDMSVSCKTNPKLEHILQVMVNRLNHSIEAM
ncbi:unnamed protein product, partial [Trichobilharzia regenti]